MTPPDAGVSADSPADPESVAYPIPSPSVKLLRTCAMIYPLKRFLKNKDLLGADVRRVFAAIMHQGVGEDDRRRTRMAAGLQALVRRLQRRPRHPPIPRRSLVHLQRPLHGAGDQPCVLYLVGIRDYSYIAWYS